MEVADKASKGTSDIFDKKFDKTIRAIKEVGFPIVAFLLLFSVAVKWADRLLSSQEIFIHKVTDAVETQTKNGTDIKIAVQKIQNAQERMENIMEQEISNEKRQTKALETILSQ